MANHEEALDRWVEHGLIGNEQRAAILDFERGRAAPVEETGPGRLANGVSTVGAAIAIFAVAGIVGLFTEDWSSAEGMAATIVAAVVMILAAWQLVRNGWGAPAGLCAICGLVLVPVSLVLGAETIGWWPEGDIGSDWEQVEREEMRITGVVLLVSILPGMLTTRLGLRQAWMALPVAVWYGIALLLDDPFETTALVIAQVLFGVVVAAFAAFLWRPDEQGRGSPWWLQIGGLGLAGLGIAVSAFDVRPGLALLAAIVAAVIFIVGAIRNRTAWMVTGALAGIFPVGSLIFEYFEGLTGLVVVAIVGLLVAFLPLLILRRRFATGR